ncbi:hypothetical protein P167DRAFT_564213 [Morchella conica CCBAS932]|uniref:Uncharacterized protein n=1 Tax=Morchella conica CCBAS932 TaxID=1392247 RepID=A0A3N4KX79_9PEZI|nr:hypothetical protein P167DRAFT_564213 [Morchella conica CCBAS932]
MDPPPQAQSHLLHELKSHHIPLTSDDVSWAFSNPKTAAPVTDWVERYLSHDTLLSLEEAEIYNHLKKTGALTKLQKQHPGLHTVRPRSEDELRAETERLSQSTELLRRQTAQLRRQGAAVGGMKTKLREEAGRGRSMEERRRRRWKAEMEGEQNAIDDLLGILREEVADFRRDGRASAVDVERVERMLQSDDRVLGRLGRLADGVIVSGDDEAGGNEVVERVTVLVKKLSTLSAAALKARLDRMFLEIVNPKNNTTTNPADADAIAELKQDLGSLYSEIPSVAQMAAEQEYLRPVIKEVENGKKKASEGLQVGGAYICDVLAHLQKRNASAAQKLQRDLAKARAIAQIIATIEQESHSPLTKHSAAPPPPAANDDTPPPSSSARPATPVKNPHPHPFKNMPIFTPPTRSHRRRSGSLGGNAAIAATADDELPELRMLTLLGVPVPSAPAQTASALFASPVKGGSPAASSQEPPAAASKYTYLPTHIRQQSTKLQTQESADVSASSEIRSAVDEFWNVSRTAQQALVWANVFPPVGRRRGVMGHHESRLKMNGTYISTQMAGVCGRVPSSLIWMCTSMHVYEGYRNLMSQFAIIRNEYLIWRVRGSASSWHMSAKLKYHLRHSIHYGASGLVGTCSGQTPRRQSSVYVLRNNT